ncbi:PRE4 (YFR050C) [Zygosaccharomyces parabailii]|uniref:Proteasome subunit beta n=1 Tax=Zygosaccharomyces bailii (strain CLIB 213 / ATCC 58445 / CBS 680 / BCRC 21525 / NBRC 1098 / NCYC 1416 / NRRL Y-2227) TaxID=1333698 RepID=A0A8J2T6R3_ZYGB2|nr:PRE4 (YFR050C) [Zygosaccharomyces parabailii]CDF89732.1 ZYBA0S05-00408g1_1 [Zygosaccharomyces bailii CLIB 213]CDH17489.1 probable Proteasome component PRE4 [Zygosaccharomyces bailii ISA1307]SJM86995.1 probable Proteasome subunit beta type-7 [Zygosaccharomyces bailii]
MNHDPFSWGRPSDAVYGAYDQSIANPKMNTQQPIVTGTSVVCVKYNNGVVIAADTMASYGSLLRFNNVERLIPVGTNTVVGISGDISDMQHIETLIEELITENNYDNSYANSAEELKPSYVFEFLAAVMYNRRSKMNPLWNSVIVAGLEDGKPFARYVNLLGVTYSSPSLASGFGSYMAVPLLRKLVDRESDVAKIDRSTAENAVVECLKVLFYRDARSSKQYSLAVIDNDSGLQIKKDQKVENLSWSFAKGIRGYGTQKV